MDNKTSLRLGEFLRSERERKNITIEQIASATKINIKLLHALESDSYDALPAKPFVRGFISNYARYIGLNPTEVIQKFDLYIDEQAGQKFKRPANSPHIFVDRESNNDNSRTILTVIMGTFLVVGLIAMAILKPAMKSRHGDRSGKVSQANNKEFYTVPLPPSDSTPIAPPVKKEVAPPAPTVLAKSILLTPPPPLPVPAAVVSSAPTAEKVKEKPVEKPIEKVATPKPVAAPTPLPSAVVAAAPVVLPSPATSAAAKAPPIPANEVKYRLVVRALVDSWVKYQSDDRPLMGFILKKDKTIYIKARNNIRFMTGNPKGVEYSYNNAPFQSFKDNVRSLILPKEVEKDFQAKMFVE